MKLTKEIEQSLRILIKESEPALRALKKQLEEELEGKQFPSSLLYKNVFQALVNLDIIKSEIERIDSEAFSSEKFKQTKMF